MKRVLSRNGIVISSHHRVTQSLTEFYSFDFKSIKLCETLCYSVVKIELKPCNLCLRKGLRTFLLSFLFLLHAILLLLTT
ncbi:hypothetical protein DWX97_20740 [Bacteroides cellulosilyticus]|uniref:Uncharacterized protein n=1 Tax=Bacteroides cellulosilyticus TaxID=246787 RepID=A0A3D6AYZ5_9BACE|nr:hypothetical protein F2Y86_08970 [Bacteroides cellulosilyticus]KAA5414669.1 hypothetical protein F2Y81_19900 [Bacteroides cellulosilyticus]RGS33824.1 hypothetical protein DWX97_20740 [Bacteroides cellulosilyticus]RYU18057.1 hypothetical protein EAJ01_09000 [Bacteroides cellulosilyticus]HCY72166.1 hypothetical protein [Bacteroides cellulosilyticus]